jgi:hypothetical protein
LKLWRLWPVMMAWQRLHYWMTRITRKGTQWILKTTSVLVENNK